MATFNLPYGGSDSSQLVLSAWEQFIRSAGVPESGCAVLCASSTQKGNAIRSWVLANYATRYVPEQILEVLGLGKRLKWNKEDKPGVFYIARGETRH